MFSGELEKYFLGFCGNVFEELDMKSFQGVCGM